MLGFVKKEEAAALASALAVEVEEPLPEVVPLALAPAFAPALAAELEPESDPEPDPELPLGKVNPPPEPNEGNFSVGSRESVVLAAWMEIEKMTVCVSAK